MEFPGNFFLPYGKIDNVAGDLPHWRQNGVIYFVTFRLADSLPKEKLARWRFEREEWLLEHPGELSPKDESEYHRLFSARIDAWLDAGSGSCLLKHPEHRDLVEQALLYFNGSRYRLGEFVVAANHVHAVVTPLGEYTLSKIMHTWKSFTAKEILKLIGTSVTEAGRLRHTVWQRESYDHIVRAPLALGRIEFYIRAHREWRRRSASD